MTRSQQAVHLQLLERLPVRRHEWQPPPERDHGSGRHRPALAAYRREQIRQMSASSVSEIDMAQSLGISKTAVRKHLRAIKAEAPPNRGKR